jgi:predicted regulator of Ras-like GTPase activity (Roadblock/LC7/MglB family)
LLEVLESFNKIDKVLGALLLTAEGEVLFTSLDFQRQEEALETWIAKVVVLGKTLASSFELGELTQSYLEYEGYNFTAEMIGFKHILVVVADTGANLGRIRLEIRKQKRAIEGMI